MMRRAKRSSFYGNRPTGYAGSAWQPLLRILLPALERRGHLKLDETVRANVLAMSAATIDRCLRTARNGTGSKKTRRITPEIRRRVPVRTFADWKEPLPGSMEMDLVGHCEEMNKGSYVNSLVLTDIASGWTECIPLVVRESGLLIEALERIRIGLPFALRALDVNNGSEFVNEAMIQYVSAMALNSRVRAPIERTTRRGSNKRMVQSYANFLAIAGSRASLRRRRLRASMEHLACS